KTFNIPLEPFWKLIQAFKMDQTKNRYQSWDELLDYCQHSADPVGHLFLYVYGHDNEELRTLSDKTCTALQLANHWQDISRDWQQNRSYLPEETMQRFGVDWNRYGPEYVDENWKSMLSFEVERAQKLFDEGKKLWKLVDAHLAVDLMMFTKGGEAILQAIRNQKFDTWKKRPKVSKLKQVRLYFKAKAEWKRASRG
ncbi:MAG TPA: squalene synthase HpnC, partial [Candidatus Poseidoniales archaeon]